MTNAVEEKKFSTPAGELPIKVVKDDTWEDFERFLELKKGTGQCKICGFSGDSHSLNFESICMWCVLERSDR